MHDALSLESAVTLHSTGVTFDCTILMFPESSFTSFRSSDFLIPSARTPLPNNPLLARAQYFTSYYSFNEVDQPAIALPPLRHLFRTRAQISYRRPRTRIEPRDSKHRPVAAIADSSFPLLQLRAAATRSPCRMTPTIDEYLFHVHAYL